MESVRDRPTTNVQAAHGVGKSFIAAAIVLWWIFAVGGVAITTAPTKEQVTKILWKEIRKAYDRNKKQLGGYRGQLFIRIEGEDAAWGFTSRDYDSNSFQGKHDAKLLLIADEACGITPEIDEGLESCLTGAENRGLRIGNPVKANTPFQEACARSHIRIPVWNHPNVAWAYCKHSDGYRLKPEVARLILNPGETDPDKIVKPQNEWDASAIAAGILQLDKIAGAVSVAWIERVRAKRGEDSPYWISRVDGRFCLDSGQSIIPRKLFQDARDRYDAEPEYWDAIAARHPWRFGLDVGDGGDPHAKAKWRGPVLYGMEEKPTQGDREDVSRAAGWLILDMKAHPGSTARVDATGVGAGTLADVRQEGLPAFPFDWGRSSPDPDYLGMKAYQFFTLAEDMRKGKVAIAPLGRYEEDLKEEFAGIYYEETSHGKERIEDKTKTRKRLKKSSNLADAATGGYRSSGGAIGGGRSHSYQNEIH